MSHNAESDIDLSRGAPLALGAAAAPHLPMLAAAKPVSPQPNEPGPFDLVISGGRVVDPETGLDARGDVGIKKGRIAAISEEPLQGTLRIAADGQIVAPGFIDLHSHAQQLPGAWMQAFDGVTSALELESGLAPIGRYYELLAKEGRPINYGASASWAYARVAEKEGIEPDGTIAWFVRAFALTKWQNTLATPEELERILARVEAWLKEGGLGIGINAGYAPGIGRKEYYQLACLAKKYEVPTYTHMRYLSIIEPFSSFEAFEELCALSAETGAHMHVCHLNSIAARDVVDCVELFRKAQARGLPITIEAYPYGAASSAVGAEMFRHPDWVHRWGAADASWMELNGKPLDQAKIDELQKSAPGTVIVMHFLKPDDDPTDQKLLDMSVLYPGAAIASDAVFWTKGSTLIEGDVWPLPEGAFAHPRAAGCFSRFIGRYVRERKVISLSDAIRKTSLIPAQILEKSTPQMRQKGRLQVGADADIVVFDLSTIKDNATFVAPARVSSGFRHVVVNGTPIIRDGNRIGDARPGKPIRRPV